MGASVGMELDVVNMIERLVPVSEFSKGKTAHIFDDVKNNNSEYIILKNNQPTAVLISLDEYKKVKRLGAYLEQVDEKMLFEQALKAQSSFKQEDAITMDELMKEYGINPAEVEKAMESVEIE